LNFLLDFSRALIDSTFATTALKVAVVVGSLLFAINHGTAIFAHEMTSSRWMSAVMTYAVPYSVSIYSQLANQRRQPEGAPSEVLLPEK
jgi:hypothetical protein